MRKFSDGTAHCGVSWIKAKLGKIDECFRQPVQEFSAVQLRGGGRGNLSRLAGFWAR
jgi:hypothetical protein